VTVRPDTVLSAIHTAGLSARSCGLLCPVRLSTLSIRNDYLYAALALIAVGMLAQLVGGSCGQLSAESRRLQRRGITRRLPGRPLVLLLAVWFLWVGLLIARGPARVLLVAVLVVPLLLPAPSHLLGGIDERASSSTATGFGRIRVFVYGVFSLRRDGPRGVGTGDPGVDGTRRGTRSRLFSAGLCLHRRHLGAGHRHRRQVSGWCDRVELTVGARDRTLIQPRLTCQHAESGF